MPVELGSDSVKNVLTTNDLNDALTGECGGRTRAFKNLGLGSIVELSQAQLQQTQGQISYAQAGYDYRLALAILRYQTTGL